MTATGTAADALDLLKEHERAMGRLYRMYAERFPQQRDFWMRLSDEEQEHAEWIGSLVLQVHEQGAGRVVNRFPAAAIAHSLIYVNKLIDSARQSGVTPIRALSVALDLEEALLENRYFEIIEGDSDEIRRTLQSLAQGTHAHLAAVRRAWQNAKQTS